MTAALRLVGSEQHDPDEWFWRSRSEFQTIRAWARARRVSPWAVLGVVLARIITNTPCNVVSPAFVGGLGSINQFFALVARSGGGKGAASATANDTLDIRTPLESVARANLGSGEGISAAFVSREKDENGELEIRQHTESVLFEVAEVDTFAATGNRTGSTLMPEVRKMWSGEPLGFQNRDSARTLPVEGHRYRAAMIVGVQPTRSGALLNDADGGTPQRFVWLPATDPYAPDHAPLPPAPLEWRMPDQSLLPTNADQKRIMQVCDAARIAIDQAQISRLRGEGDALDGHALFSRLKLAAALALLAERGDVNEEDWELSGAVMRVSDRTRQACLDALSDAAKRANVARAEARAEAAAVTADHTETAVIERAKERVLRQLGDDWIGAARVRKGLSSKIREHFDRAIEDLLEVEAIEVFHDLYQGQPRIRYRLKTATGVANPSPLTITPQNPHDSNDLRGDTAAVAEQPPLTTNVTPDEQEGGDQ